MDIAPIFNLIQAGSLDGHFSNLYTQPRYMAGLGMQLFSLWKNARIQLPDGTCHQASMRVLRVGDDFAGFIIIRHEANQPDEVEIYMCGLVDGFRAKGLGEWMLRAALSEIPRDYTVSAECLPSSFQMKSLLRKLGFKQSNLPTSTQSPQVAQRFVYAETSVRPSKSPLNICLSGSIAMSS
ncbi:MAG: GNAT family N-acetyltransferase [Rhodocyclaceae bacterium]|nr:MAG: GNAT family N-acetyltransferase [Rhodocyclaceae bacterium]